MLADQDIQPGSVVQVFNCDFVRRIWKNAGSSMLEVWEKRERYRRAGFAGISKTRECYAFWLILSSDSFLDYLAMEKKRQPHQRNLRPLKRRVGRYTRLQLQGGGSSPIHALVMCPRHAPGSGLRRGAPIYVGGFACRYPDEFA